MMQLLRSILRKSFAGSDLQIHFRLPPKQLKASWKAMLGRLASLSIVFVLLFGTVILPSIAHAQAPEHTGESFEAHEHGASSDSDKKSDESDKPCHAVTHHHCSFAVGVEAGQIKELATYLGNRTRPGSSDVMPSWSQAPPTQPPST